MRIDPSTLDLKEKVVYINRVTKVVKGGRNFRFSALVVVNQSKSQKQSKKVSKTLRKTWLALL